MATFVSFALLVLDVLVVALVLTLIVVGPVALVRRTRRRGPAGGGVRPSSAPESGPPASSGP